MVKVFLMSCGNEKFRFPDDWMTTEQQASRPIFNSHINKWWSRGCPKKVRVGDIAVLVATKSGKVMGAFEVVANPEEDRSHPDDAERYSWTVLLRPLVLLDGAVAPVLWDLVKLQAPRTYRSINANVAAKLLEAIHPKLTL